ncbi:hypothetical protein BJV82DRAFT_669317 [Fennellomyces sp. T-0311]|nr:hypothetical protein BJV82DRAFT_669317 [Fennellomyces sp. T-0311]
MGFPVSPYKFDLDTTLTTVIYKSIQRNPRITARNQEISEATDLHESLLDLELKAREITSAGMAIILKRCMNVTRLVVLGCDIDSVRAIGDNYPSELQILSINNDSAVSPLQPENVAAGSSMLYTSNESPGIDASALLPIIKNNVSSLVVARINIDCSNLQENLGYLRLSNICRMTLWCDKDGQELFIGALSQSSQLEYLTLLGVTDIDSLVGRLIASYLPLTTLRIFHTYNPDEAHNFSRLFSAMNRTLNTIELASCSGLDDETINALAHVTTLKHLSIASQPDVSADALFALFSPREDSLKFVKLAPMRNVTDNVLESLGRANQLRTLFITNLQKISGSGIMFLVDHTKTISRLNIQNCANIPGSAIAYARRKIKGVSHLA